MQFLGWRKEDARRIDVLVDIDATLVYPLAGGPLPPPTRPSADALLGAYSLAHGALQFLAALDALGFVRLGLYSCGPPERNRRMARALVHEIRKQGFIFKQDLKVFSVPQGNRGKKVLKGLRRGLHLDRTILVDDGGRNCHPGEERNLLKLYDFGCPCHDLTAAHRLYSARLCNNLVRALGMILLSIDNSPASTVVHALHDLQWDSDNMYRHDLSNGKDVYQRGLQAMQALTLGFSLAYPTTSPWSSLPHADDAIFPRRPEQVIRDSNDAL